MTTGFPLLPLSVLRAAKKQCMKSKNQKQALLQPFIMQLVTFVSVKTLRKNDLHTIISRHAQYKDVYRTIEIPQCTHIL